MAGTKGKKVVKKKVYDLGNLDCTKAANEGAEVELRHPVTDKGIGAFIGILGTDSDVYQKALNKLRNKRIQAAKNAETVDMTAEDIDKQNIDLLAICSTSFRDVLVDGILVEFSFDNAVKFYTRFGCFKDQINTHMGDRTNFLK